MIKSEYPVVLAAGDWIVVKILPKVCVTGGVALW